MRLDEIVSLNDVLKADQYVTLLHRLSAKSGNDINITRIKNKIIKAWKRGMKSRKHFEGLLNEINLSLNDLIHK